MRDVIGIHSGDVCTLCLCRSGIERVGDADAGFMQEFDPWVMSGPSFPNGCAGIGARIVDQQ